MPTPRETIIERVRKLRKMTETAGATEAEAQTAIGLIAKLMAEYGLTESETQLRADAQGCLTDYLIIMQARIDEWRPLAATIAKLYPTVTYGSRVTEDILDLGMPESAYHVKFFGFPADVAAAVSTMGICVMAATTESAGMKGQTKRLSFRIGMVERLVERIKAITAQRPTAATGTGLMVIKDQLVKQEFAKHGPKLYSARAGRATQIDPAARASGRAAGDRVDLSTGPKVPHSHTVRRLA